MVCDISDLHSFPSDIHDQRIKLVRGRYISGPSFKYLQNVEFNNDFIFLDPMNNPENLSFLNRTESKNYNYNLLGTTQFGDSKVYIINFDQKKAVKKSLYCGTIYIDSNSFAIIKIIYYRSEIGLRFYKIPIQATISQLIAPIKFKRLLKDSLVADYYKLNEKYYLVSASRSSKSVHKSNITNSNFTLNINTFFVTTEFETNVLKTIHDDELIIHQDYKGIIERKYDSNFWNNFNSLELEQITNSETILK